MVERVFSDIAVIGSGIIGLSTALACAQAGANVAIVTKDSSRPPTAPEAMVSALNARSWSFLESLGVVDVLEETATHYIQMQVRTTIDQGIDWHAFDTHRKRLGFVVNNQSMLSSLWGALQRYKSRVKWYTFAPTSWQGSHLLGPGIEIRPQALLGCDGVHSWLRTECSIQATTSAYKDTAVSGVITHSEAHGGCARQVFLPCGILGLLPTSSPYRSIYIFSYPQENDKESKESVVYEAVAKNFVDLGKVTVEKIQTKQVIQGHHVHHYTQGRATLLGDAALRLHPMAGLGLNCGLQSVASYTQAWRHAYCTGHSHPERYAAEQYTKDCRGYNHLTYRGIEMLRCYSQGTGAQTSLYWAFGIAQRYPWIARRCIEHALHGVWIGEKEYG
tara:strand:+ start:650 stop:1816 length:1167 start_codon:yes stop_codon:yes gene_type:complete